jgi:hypothetical protein
MSAQLEQLDCRAHKAFKEVLAQRAYRGRKAFKGLRAIKDFRATKATKGGKATKAFRVMLGLLELLVQMVCRAFKAFRV